MKRIYLDNSSTSYPKPKSVIMAMSDYFYENGSNLQRGESSYNFDAEDVIMSLREELSKLVSSNNPECVIFTPNVTTALNTVIRGYLKSGDHVIISPLEHNAVMRPLVENNISYTLLDSDSFGHVIEENIKKSIKKETKACIIQGANNVTGCVQNINKIGNTLKEYGIPLILDSAQSLGHIDYNLEKDNISILCFTGHKSLFGPQGTGGFITNSEIIKEIKPLIYGGTGSFSDLLTQPDNLPDKFESGTQNIIGLMGLNAAINYLKDNKENIRKTERELRSYFISLLDNIKCIEIHSYSDEIPIVSISSNSFDVAKLANFLSSNNIQTRVGLHCNVMTHKFINTYPSGTIRFSFSHFNTKAELDMCFCYIKEFLNEEGLL
ncbi:MAG: aminotransferase class V-fold PLP-dependent enzyme [Spirochaetales bacterium]|nr:aminotransferase class V-fold PLP-dependent enzyme [Spirochaetales bacterium]